MMKTPSIRQSCATDALSDLAREALWASETRYRRLFETAEDGILLLNAETAQIEDAKPCLIDMPGCSHAAFLGKKLWEVGPFGRAPTGTATHKNYLYWCQDFLNDPATIPWRTRAVLPVEMAKHSYRATQY